MLLTYVVFQPAFTGGKLGVGILTFFKVRVCMQKGRNTLSHKSRLYNRSGVYFDRPRTTLSSRLRTQGRASGPDQRILPPQSCHA